MGRHARRLVHKQQVLIFPDHRQRPVSRGDSGPGRAAVLRLHRQHVSGPEHMRRMDRDPVDKYARPAMGQPGDGVRGEVELGPKNVPDSGPILLW